MKLVLFPIRMDARLTASVHGETLTLNDDVLDFGSLAAGASLPQADMKNPWVAGDVTRDAQGNLSVPILLPHGATAPNETLFPRPIDIADGHVPLPPRDMMVEDTASRDGEEITD